MSEVFNLEEENNVVQLKVVQGGSTQPPRIGYDWLRELDEEAAFLVSYRGKEHGIDRWRAFEYHLNIKLEKCAFVSMIRWEGPMAIETKTWVTIDDFCKEWECVEIIYDGSGNRSDIPTGLDNHEDNNGAEGNVEMDENSG